MASTRNKNTPGDYQLEQWAQNRRFEDITYIHSTQGRPVQPYFPGNGLNGARIAGKDLAKNDCDIESFLFGIGSTNLVQPLSPITPNINHIPSLNIMDRTPMILPKPLIVEPNQRQHYLN